VGNRSQEHLVKLAQTLHAEDEPPRQTWLDDVCRCLKREGGQLTLPTNLILTLLPVRFGDSFPDIQWPASELASH
jgi:hypothetical protein